MFQLIFPIFCALVFNADPVTFPDQPAEGPGGAEYVCDAVLFQDFAQEADGYWLFEPVGANVDSAHVVVFVHGYGGYNPMIYGQWIRHIVRKGNIVIYPRYQKNVFSPRPKKFAKNVSTAIRGALTELEKEGHVKPIVSNLAMVGHSYGGVVSADLAIHFAEHEIPPPKVVLLCAPGSGQLKGGRLEDYGGMPADVSLLVVTHEGDWVVGDEFAQKVFKEATAVEKRNLIHQKPDDHGEPRITADHNEAYSLDMEFDSGARNYTSKKALRMATVDVVDYYGYWKLFDAMLACDRSGEYCEVAFGSTDAQVGLGEWSDGKPILPLEVQLPD